MSTAATRPPTPGPPLTVWLVNQYAIRPGDAGMTRHNMLAERLVRQGMTVTILAGGRHYARQSENMLERRGNEIIDGVEYRWLPVRNYEGNGLQRVRSMVEFGGTIARAKDTGPIPDVIIGSSPHLFAALGAWALARRYRAAFVLEVRDLWPGSLIHMTGMSPNHPVAVSLAAVEKFLYRHADQIAGVLPGVRDRVEEVVPGAGSKVTWVPNGVDLTRRSTQPEPAANGNFRYVYAGTHGVPNSLETLLEAAEVLQGRGRTDLEFHLYGDGVNKAALVRQAQEQKLNNVHFHDFVPKSQIPQILAAADGLVLCWRDTPLYEHGVSPNKIFDYFAAEKPVVQSLTLRPDLDPVAESGAGVTVPAQDPTALADALAKVADMPASERQAWGRAGRVYAQSQHDMDLLGTRLADLLRAATMSFKGRSPRRATG